MRVAVVACLATVLACGGPEPVTVPPPVDAGFASLSAGLLHTCGITTTNHLYCWGWNRDGEIGDGSVVDRVYAVQVSQSLTFSVVSSGGGHTCAVAMGDAGYCWGLNLTGQIGDSTVMSRSTPTMPKGSLSFTGITTGGTFSCGLSATDSTAWCWGWARDGELGSRPTEVCSTSGGPEPCSRAPIAVGGALRFMTISAGVRHVCALTPDSTAYCWGNNDAGQLGNGTLADTALPVAVSGGLHFKAVTLGFSHSCGLTVSGDAYCWGDNTWAQLGEAATAQASTPRAVNGGIIFLSLSAGAYHTCGIGTGNSASCWGENANGQLGAPTTETCTGPRTVLPCTHVPVPVTTNQIFASISAGGSHTCAITTGGRAYCWGENANGQLGTGNTSGANVPVRVANQP